MIKDFFISVLGIINNVTHNYGLTLLVFAVFVKGVLNPFSKPMLKAQKDMERIKPLQKEIEDRYPDDPQKRMEEIAKLWKEHNVAHPGLGCLLMFVQLPILFGILQAITSQPEVFNNAYFLWIRPGTLQSHFPGIFASSLADPDLPLVLIYGVMMLLYQQTSPSAMDPAQRQTGLIMSVMFTFMVWKFSWPCALVLYWSAFQFLGIMQQVLMIAGDRPPEQKAAAKV